MYANSKIPSAMANEELVKFIELYKRSECLWKVSCENYRSKLSRNAAYWKISRKMAIPGFGPREVARKIKHFKCLYEEEARRVKSSENSGGPLVYRPKVAWFNLLDSFLKPVFAAAPCNCRSTEEKEEADHRVVPNTSSKRKSSTTAISIKDTTKLLHRSVEEEEEEENEEEEEAIGYETFGRYVAEALGKMPFECAISAESEIHDTIIKYKIYAMRKIYSSIDALATSAVLPYDENQSSSVDVSDRVSASTVPSNFH